MSFLSEGGVCEHCGVSDCFHDRDHLVIECYPKQIDALRQRVADMTRAVEFARWVIEEGPFSGCDLDGGTVQDKAAELGLIELTTYDPAKHGEGHDFTEPGDDWYVFTAAFLYLLSDEADMSDREPPK